MKNFKTLILSFFAIALLATSGFAQKSFEGRIEFGLKLLGENADQMAAFLPESYEYNVKGSDVLFKMNGGMSAAMMGDFLVNGKSGNSYMVKHPEQTAYKMPLDDANDAKPEVTVKKLDEVIKIQGYDCQKHEVTTKGIDGSETTQLIWVTDQINFVKPKNTKALSSAAALIPEVDGFPLKMITETMGMKMVMTATSVEKKALDASIFVIPKSYTVKDFDAKSLFGGMMGK